MSYVKVCGLNNRANADKIAASDANYLGFIFYDKSSRAVSKGDLTPADLRKFDQRKVGVFVNESLSRISMIVEEFDLNYVQLHGDETPQFCWELKSLGLGIIKAIRVGDNLTSNDLEKYEHVIDLYLFDTSGAGYGGTGLKFNWDLLDQANISLPFFLSGGIGPNDIEALKNVVHPKLYGYDINSRFEISPGIKDDLLVRNFINEIKK